MDSLDLKAARKRPQISLLFVLYCSALVTYLVVSCTAFFETPKIGDTAAQVRAKMGEPNLIYREPAWPDKSTQSRWYVARTKTSLLPEELPEIEDVRWSFQVGFLHTVFILVDLKDGKVKEIYEGGT